MEIINVQESPDTKRITFVLQNVDASIANSLRRVILAEVPNIAIAFDPYEESLSDIKFITNTSRLHNEFLGHRISLIPLYFDYDFVDNFDPEKYRFVLHEKNTTNTDMIITSKDIKIFENNRQLSASECKEILPPDAITKDYILITKLKPNFYDLSKGEEINIEFTCSKNIAKTHARWSLVNQCTYFNTIDERAAAAARETFENKNQFDTLEKYRYYIKNEYGDACSFTFSIESESKMTARFIFTKGIEVLMQKVKDMSTKVSVIDEDIERNFYTLKYEDEDDTIGNLIQSFIYNNYTRTQNVLVEYVGYHKPHPLENNIVMKIKFAKNKNNVLEFMVQAADECYKYLSQIHDLWTKGGSVAAKPLSLDATKQLPAPAPTPVKEPKPEPEAPAAPKPKSKAKPKVVEPAPVVTASDPVPVPPVPEPKPLFVPTPKPQKSKSKTKPKASVPKEAAATRKTRRVIVSSSSEEENEQDVTAPKKQVEFAEPLVTEEEAPTPAATTTTTKEKKMTRRKVIIDSDDDDEEPPAAPVATSTVKPAAKRQYNRKKTAPALQA